MIVKNRQKSPKIANKFCCKICDYYSSKQYDFEKHLSTDKHKKQENDSKTTQNDSNLSQKIAQFKCECGKAYKYDSGYYRHKKNCQLKKTIDITDRDQLIMMLVKQNSELIKEASDLKTIMMEVIKNGTHNTTNNNSHNKSFNLNFFLNETCKDAMNIMDFVNSIKLQLFDLEKVGELGYIEGISNIIVKNLKELDVSKRPVHCTDKKR